LAAQRDIRAGAPAASALGSHAGPFAVHFLAGKTGGLTLENPRQMPAWQYPSDYGPRSPTFSRALLLPTAAGQLTLCISGTASIVGHHSMHLGQVAQQTEETLRNLQAVIDVAKSRSNAGFRLDDLTCIVYVRHAHDVDRARQVIEAQLGAGSRTARQAVYLQGDICREELLVEIEAHAQAPGVLLPPRPTASAPLSA
jgi:chorismate lyase / 3-hydroxybenzoate synthase